MIDLAYKIGSGETDGDFLELRYSIRSAVRHFKDLGNIYIIGHKPSWLVNVKHIKLDDCYTHNKDGNLINKLILACFDKDLSETFLNMSDDYFFLKDINGSFFTQIWHNDKVLETIEKKKKGEIEGNVTKWERRVEKTINTLKAKNLSSHCYETHTPTLIDKNLYPHILFNYDYGDAEGLCGNTLYYNTLRSESIQLTDDFLRIEQKQLDINCLLAMVENKTFLNYTVTTYNHIMSQFLRDRFTEKTKFEI